MRLTWPQVRRWRMRRQLLVEPADGLLAAARRVCGLHAQVASCTELIAGVRAAGVGGGAAQRAAESDRSLVKIWAMRGTLHLLPAAELPLRVAALTDKDARRSFPPSWDASTA